MNYNYFIIRGPSKYFRITKFDAVKFSSLYDWHDKKHPLEVLQNVYYTKSGELSHSYYRTELIDYDKGCWTCIQESRLSE